MPDTIEIINEEIDQCRRCDEQGLTVEHSRSMERGRGSNIMIIGIEPGATEQETGVAFSGRSGRVLKNWLNDVGLSSDENFLFNECFLTSVRKCRAKKSETKQATRNCRPFLDHQIDIVKPSVISTLGADAFFYFTGIRAGLDDLIGNAFHSAHFGLFPPFAENSILVPLPHPSPLNRWLNDRDNITKLNQSLEIVRENI